MSNLVVRDTSLEISATLEAAANWYLKLSSGGANENDKQAWQQWKEAAIEHELAWQRVEEITGIFKSVPANIGLEALDRSSKNLPSAGRRRALKQLGIVLAVGSASWAGYRQQPWQPYLADYATATGEQREILLADGTRLFLNTASSVDIYYDAHQRLVKLHAGEILVETGHAPAARHRPFVLATKDGAVTAMGTRFSVRKFDDYSKVIVFSHAVSVATASDKIIVQAGESIAFSTSHIAAKRQADLSSDHWTNGFIVVDKARLADFIAELARYRQGFLRCDPDVGDLYISGSFPIHDTDAVLAGLTQALPIQVRQYTRYWTSISAA